MENILIFFMWYLLENEKTGGGGRDSDPRYDAQALGPPASRGGIVTVGRFA
jgi:hypothetical protein